MSWQHVKDVSAHGLIGRAHLTRGLPTANICLPLLHAVYPMCIEEFQKAPRRSSCLL
jgi:hypothetical protein